MQLPQVGGAVSSGTLLNRSTMQQPSLARIITTHSVTVSEKPAQKWPPSFPIRPTVDWFVLVIVTLWLLKSFQLQMKMPLCFEGSECTR